MSDIFEIMRFAEETLEDGKYSAVMIENMRFQKDTAGLHRVHFQMEEEGNDVGSSSMPEEMIRSMRDAEVFVQENMSQDVKRNENESNSEDCGSYDYSLIGGGHSSQFKDGEESELAYSRKGRESHSPILPSSEVSENKIQSPLMSLTPSPGSDRNEVVSEMTSGLIIVKNMSLPPAVPGSALRRSARKTRSTSFASQSPPQSQSPSQQSQSQIESDLDSHSSFKKTKVKTNAKSRKQSKKQRLSSSADAGVEVDSPVVVESQTQISQNSQNSQNSESNFQWKGLQVGAAQDTANTESIMNMNELSQHAYNDNDTSKNMNVSIGMDIDMNTHMRTHLTQISPSPTRKGSEDIDGDLSFTQHKSVPRGPRGIGIGDVTAETEIDKQNTQSDKDDKDNKDADMDMNEKRQPWGSQQYSQSQPINSLNSLHSDSQYSQQSTPSATQVKVKQPSTQLSTQPSAPISPSPSIVVKENEENDKNNEKNNEVNEVNEDMLSDELDTSQLDTSLQGLYPLKEVLHLDEWPAFLRENNRSFAVHMPDVDVACPLGATNKGCLVYWTRNTFRYEGNLGLHLCLWLVEKLGIDVVVLVVIDDSMYGDICSLGPNCTSTSVSGNPQVFGMAWSSKRRKALAQLCAISGFRDELHTHAPNVPCIGIRSSCVADLEQQSNNPSASVSGEGSKLATALFNYIGSVNSGLELTPEVILAVVTDDISHPSHRRMFHELVSGGGGGGALWESGSRMDSVAIVAIDSNSFHIPTYVFEKNKKLESSDRVQYPDEEGESLFCADFHNSLNNMRLQGIDAWSILEKKNQKKTQKCHQNKKQHGDEEVSSRLMKAMQPPSPSNLSKTSTKQAQRWVLNVHEWGNLKESVHTCSKNLVLMEASHAANAHNITSCLFGQGQSSKINSNIYSEAHAREILLSLQSHKDKGRLDNKLDNPSKVNDVNDVNDTNTNRLLPKEKDSMLQLGITNSIEMLWQHGLISPPALISALCGPDSSSSGQSAGQSESVDWIEVFESIERVDYSRHLCRMWSLHLNVDITDANAPWVNLFPSLELDNPLEGDSKTGATIEASGSGFDLFPAELCGGKIGSRGKAGQGVYVKYALFNALQNCLRETSSPPKGLAMQFWIGFYLQHGSPGTPGADPKLGIRTAMLELARHSALSIDEVPVLLIPMLGAASQFLKRCKHRQQQADASKSSSSSSSSDSDLGSEILDEVERELRKAVGSLQIDRFCERFS